MKDIPECPNDEIHDLLAGYALGTLEPEETRFIEQNLSHRPRWQEELDRYRQVATALAHAPEPQDVPLRVRANVLGEVAGVNEPAGDPEPAPLPLWRRRLARVAYATALPATLVAILLVAYTIIMHDRIQNQGDELAQFQQVQGEAVQVLAGNESLPTVIDMAQTSAAPLARARLFVDRAGLQAVLVARDLPPLAHGEVYMVWIGGGDSGNPLVQIGELNPSEQGTGQITIGPLPDLSRLNQVSVTREPSADTTTPQGEVVLSATF